jgi:hypothetical protein
MGLSKCCRARWIAVVSSSFHAGDTWEGERGAETWPSFALLLFRGAVPQGLRCYACPAKRPLGSLDGSIYFSDGFIDRLTVFDTQIQGSWHQSNSVIFRDAEFHGLNLSGDIELSRSALRKLLLSSSNIQGGLYLNDTEARCAYQIKANNIRSVAIENGGFGTMATLLTGQNKSVLDEDGNLVGYAWWNQLLEVPAGDQGDRQYNFIGARLASRAAAESIAKENKRIFDEPASPLRGCADRTPGTAPEQSSFITAKNAEFHFFDNRVQSFCLRSFAWMSPNGDPAAQRSSHPVTILALNGSSIGSNLIADLQRRKKHSQDAPDRELTKKNRFEALSVSMETLIWNFSSDSPEYIAYLDGLKFNQVQDAALGCDYQQPKAERTGIQIAKTNIGKSSEDTRGRVGLPSVEAVKQWLKKNGADSSQPFEAFVKAFERAGGDATDLHIARRSRDVCERTIGWLSLVEWFCSKRMNSREAREAYATEPDQSPKTSAAQAVIGGGTDISVIAFQWMLWGLADHGLPGRAQRSIRCRISARNTWSLRRTMTTKPRPRDGWWHCA